MLRDYENLQDFATKGEADVNRLVDLWYDNHEAPADFIPDDTLEFELGWYLKNDAKRKAPNFEGIEGWRIVRPL